MIKIVITGGPCGGKSTAMERIKQEFAARDYTVLQVAETATELITGGVAPWTCGSNGEYQLCQTKLQLEKERVYELAADTMHNDRILIVCDRGMLDNKAYMTEEEFDAALKFIGMTEAEALSEYGAVFHLVTAAKGAARFYTTANNSARTETVAEAVALDDRIIEAWKKHPRFYVIDNSSDFEGKIHRLISDIASYLEETEN